MSADSKTPSQLAPEQQKALQEFTSHLPSWESKVEPFPAGILPSGFFSFSTSPFPKLAHDTTWIWNQTNGKVSIITDEGEEILLQKLNARKRRGYPKAPSYKVWQYTMQPKSHRPPTLYAIWCEKGASAGDLFPAEVARDIRIGKRITPLPLDSETTVNVPTIQQVKEFNQIDSILKKRDRSSAFPAEPESPAAPSPKMAFRPAPLGGFPPLAEVAGSPTSSAYRPSLSQIFTSDVHQLPLRLYPPPQLAQASSTLPQTLYPETTIPRIFSTHHPEMSPIHQNPSLSSPAAELRPVNNIPTFPGRSFDLAPSSPAPLRRVELPFLRSPAEPPAMRGRPLEYSHYYPPP